MHKNLVNIFKLVEPFKRQTTNKNQQQQKEMSKSSRLGLKFRHPLDYKFESQSNAQSNSQSNAHKYSPN